MIAGFAESGKELPVIKKGDLALFITLSIIVVLAMTSIVLESLNSY